MSYRFRSILSQKFMKMADLDPGLKIEVSSVALFCRKSSLLKPQGSQESLISLNPLNFEIYFQGLETPCFCYNVLESPWKHEKQWMFFKVIALNYLYFPKFRLLMMLRFLPVTHDLWELPGLTYFWIHLNKYPHLSTTEAKILIGRLICTSKD